MAKVQIPDGMLSMFAKAGAPNVQDSGAEEPRRETEKASAIADSSPAAGVPVQDSVAATTQAVGGGQVEASVPAVVPAESGGAGAGAKRTTGAEFRGILDKLDSMLKEQTSPVVVAMCRDVVKRVMIELREFPEYAGIVKDSDIRNVFIFLRRLVGETKEAALITKEKSAKRQAKAGAIVIPQDMPSDLAMLGNMNFDDVNATLGLGKK